MNKWKLRRESKKLLIHALKNDTWEFDSDQEGSKSFCNIRDKYPRPRMDYWVNTYPVVEVIFRGEAKDETRLKYPVILFFPLWWCVVAMKRRTLRNYQRPILKQLIPVLESERQQRKGEQNGTEDKPDV